MLSIQHDSEHARHAVDETASLLESDRCNDDGGVVNNTIANTLSIPNRGATARQRSFNKARFIILIVLVIFIIDLAFCLISAPQTEIFEHIICEAYYESNSPLLTSTRSRWSEPSSGCIVDGVQSELATLKQVKETLDMIPSLILAVPYGILADTFGRKPIMLMSMIGIAAETLFDVLICWLPQVFKVRMIWGTPVLQVLGGGIAVTNSMLYTMVADYLEPTDR
ncbi:hypothetical protein CC86DRAFT_403446 [Ophiobolus disseminans]|uniref:Major facilitator superfamily (MFS) profile domain-containing protein n=1 Tax=Ophiobolus disseminans TaxID=1469910 RepID=A0A6A7AA03_9PLEO|nr:hypothetical protein CC86DRAFT_403446 [Ophiobolus disseminans]